jgi:hypothetical protein
MASFKETFKLERDKKGPGKTFTWTDKNGKTETYSTNYAGEEKKPSGTGTKPKAKPAGLNPQSGASRSTAGKVKPASTVKRPAKADEMSGQKAAPSLSGASRSTAGKVAPKMSQTERAMAEAKAAKAAKDAKAKSKKTVAPATTTAKPKALTPFQRLGNIVAGGGFSNYLKKK